MSDYRITPIGDQFQPEMLYTVGHLPGLEPTEKWVPLNRDGYWHNPDTFSTGLLTGCPMSRDDAERAIWRAKLLNRSAA